MNLNKKVDVVQLHKRIEELEKDFSDLHEYFYEPALNACRAVEEYADYLDNGGNEGNPEHKKIELNLRDKAIEMCRSVVEKEDDEVSEV